MKTRQWSVMFLAAGALLGATGCTDITTEPESTVSGANIFTQDPNSYRYFLAKLYAGLAVTGMEGQGGAGQADVAGVDEGFSQYVRQLWQLQELPTDEAIIAWGDADLPEMNTQLWGSSNQFIRALYYRIYFQVALANEFLRETTDAKLSERGVSEQLRAEIHQYRAEARFLRALSYWHALDLYGSVPLVTETSSVTELPQQATRAALFEFVESELNAIRGELPTRPQYGRAGQAAADMVLAKLYLNAEVYTGAARWSDALTASQRVIDAGYTLDDNYQDIFLADNHTSPEIIFPVAFDGINTRTWGGTTFLVHAAIGGDMRDRDYGVDGAWWGIRATPQFVALFEGGADGYAADETRPDERSQIFFTRNQSLEINGISAFQQGYAAPKYRNVTRSGAAGADARFPDTDFPMFRLADAYLMYAEAALRGGGNRAQALQYVNDIRERAYGEGQGQITDGQLTLNFILAERGRELFWEAHRRTDLVRFGLFTGGEYVWSFKGNVAAGTSTEEFRDLYPIPSSDLSANPNLKQNTGY